MKLLVLIVTLVSLNGYSQDILLNSQTETIQVQEIRDIDKLTADELRAKLEQFRNFFGKVDNVQLNDGSVINIQQSGSSRTLDISEGGTGAGG